MMFRQADFLAQNLVTQWVDTDARPHLVIDRALEIHWSNKASAQHLLYCDVLQDRDGYLAGRTLEHHARLEAFAASVTARVSTLSLAEEERSGRLVLRGQVINQLGQDENAGGDRLGLRLFREDVGALIKLSDELPEVYGLTRAECIVLEALMQGSTAEQASSRIGVSIETVRTHIRRIHRKLNVTSREQLYARLQSYLLMA